MTTDLLGNELNLLPILMMLVTLAGAFTFDARGLAPSVVSKQRRNLVLLAFVFFAALYTFPAAMVLYWTTGNTIQLVKDQIKKYATG